MVACPSPHFLPTRDPTLPISLSFSAMFTPPTCSPSQEHWNIFTISPTLKKKIPPPGTPHSPTTSLHLNIEIHLFLLSLPPTIWLSSYNLVGNIHALPERANSAQGHQERLLSNPSDIGHLGSDTLGCEFQLLQSRLTPYSCLVLSLISAYVSASSEDCHDD